MSISKFMIAGNLVSDPVNKGGYGFAKLAVDRSYRDKENNRISDFFDVTIHGQKAIDVWTKYYKKGDGVLIEGSLETKRLDISENKYQIVPVLHTGFPISVSGRRPRAEAVANEVAPAAAETPVATETPVPVADTLAPLCDDDDDLPF